MRNDPTKQIARATNAKATCLRGGERVVGHMKCSNLDEAIARNPGIARAQQPGDLAAYPCMRGAFMPMLGHQARSVPTHLPILRLSHDLSPCG